jgi:hypothetical protein
VGNGRGWDCSRRQGNTRLGAGADGVKFGITIIARYAAALKAAHRPEEARALLKGFRDLEIPVASKSSRSPEFAGLRTVPDRFD